MKQILTAALCSSALLFSSSPGWSAEGEGESPIAAGNEAEAAAKEKAEEDAAAEEKAEEDAAAKEKAEEEKAKKKKFIIGVDGNFTVPISERLDSVGGGFTVRVGSHRPLLGILAYRKEIGVGYTRLDGLNTGRAFVGGRFGLNFLVGIYGYAHAGVGWGAPDVNFMYDVGGAIDLLVLNFIRPGFHVQYEHIVSNMESVNVGFHIELAL